MTKEEKETLVELFNKALDENIIDFEDFEEHYYIDPDYAKINDNDRILDIKLIYSSKYNVLSGSKGSEGKNIIILAITNNILFQFQGKDSFDNVFDNYSIKNGSILKGYKSFLGNDKIENFKFSKIQLINQYLISSKEENKTENIGVLVGFMTKSGYCLGRLNNLFEYKPQNQFTVFTYVSKTFKDKIYVNAVVVFIFFHFFIFFCAFYFCFRISFFLRYYSGIETNQCKLGRTGKKRH